MKQLTEIDQYHLNSIMRNLRDLAYIASEADDCSALGMEVLYDNIDWLEYFIDANKEKKDV